MDEYSLTAEFPPVTTAEWEAAIAKDLKGADYDRTLVWSTDEGIAVRPYYRSENLPAFVNFIRSRTGEWEEAQSFTPPSGAIRADEWHDAGATAVQELGLALAEATEKQPPDVLFVFAVGSNYFFEISKLRAMRLLWQDEHRPARIHVRTARVNKSVYDPYTNLLRVTTEALSAVIGGCDSLTVEPFGFDPHLAANVQRILREEAHIAEAQDPAAGSYYIESLTDSLATEARKLVAQIEAEGGWSSALRSGFVENAVSIARAAKSKAIALRRRTLVGVNNYPNLAEKEPSFVPPPSDHPRLAEPFELIRMRTAAHAKQTGRYPQVLLLKRGDLRMKMARANFCLNFFGCAGFDIVESDQLSAVDADLIVLCSSDPEYLSLAQEVCPEAKAPVLVAGNPKDQIEALRAAGVQGFVHAQSNAVETLTEWQDKLHGAP